VPDSSDVFVSTRQPTMRATGRSHSAPRTRRASGLLASGAVHTGRGAFLPDLVPKPADAYRATSTRPASARATSPGDPAP
jgi:hypothetical protein